MLFLTTISGVKRKEQLAEDFGNVATIDFVDDEDILLVCRLRGCVEVVLIFQVLENSPIISFPIWIGGTGEEGFDFLRSETSLDIAGGSRYQPQPILAVPVNLEGLPHALCFQFKRLLLAIVLHQLLQQSLICILEVVALILNGPLAESLERPILTHKANIPVLIGLCRAQALHKIRIVV